VFVFVFVFVTLKFRVGFWLSRCGRTARGRELRAFQAKERGVPSSSTSTADNCSVAMEAQRVHLFSISATLNELVAHCRSLS